jgi:hypothetical protein
MLRRAKTGTDRTSLFTLVFSKVGFLPRMDCGIGPIIVQASAVQAGADFAKNPTVIVPGKDNNGIVLLLLNRVQLFTSCRPAAFLAKLKMNSASVFQVRALARGGPPFPADISGLKQTFWTFPPFSFPRRQFSNQLKIQSSAIAFMLLSARKQAICQAQRPLYVARQSAVRSRRESPSSLPIPASAVPA